MSLIDLVRERVHRTCTELITTQHDALVAHAQARHEAEAAHRRVAGEALGESRATVERLEAELAAARADADQADASRHAMVQALAAALGGDDDAEQQIQDLREQRDLAGLRDSFLEVWAIRSGLEHLAQCPDTHLREHLHAAVLRLLERTDERSREVRELDAKAIDNDEAGVRA